MKFCGNCGKQINDTAKFCPYCGATADESGDAVNSNNNNQKQVYQPIPSVGQKPTYQTPNQHPGRPKSDTTTLVIIGAIVVAIILGVFFKDKISPPNRNVAQNPSKVTTNSNQKAQQNNVSKPANNSTSAQSDTPAPNMVGAGVVTDEEGLNIRQGPGTNYGIITALPYGTLVNIKTENNGWYRVVASGTSGWCSANFIGRIGGVNRYGKIVDGETNIRSGPSANSKILGVFGNGEKVRVMGQYSGWYIVQRLSGSGNTAWVFADLVALQ